MCGRFRLSRDGKKIIEDFVVAGEIEWSPRYNIAPTDAIPIIRQDPHNPVRKSAVARWGLRPSMLRQRPRR
jgi:putative SOS response-associated peptidase YedK